MARVNLREPDRHGYDLPDLCMKCGAPAMVYKAKNFSWHPGWVYVLAFFGVLPFVFVALVLTKRMAVSVPLCEAHRNHWLWRYLIICGSFLALFILGLSSLLLSVEPHPGRGARGELTGLVCVGCVLGLVLWLVMAVVLSLTAIRATEITDRSITLSGVCAEFADAFYEERRESAKEEGPAVRARRPQDRNRPRRDDRYRRDDQEPRQKERFGEEEG
jgi:hypothetical protein